MSNDNRLGNDIVATVSWIDTDKELSSLVFVFWSWQEIQNIKIDTILSSVIFFVYLSNRVKLISCLVAANALRLQLGRT